MGQRSSTSTVRVARAVGGATAIVVGLGLAVGTAAVAPRTDSRAGVTTNLAASAATEAEALAATSLAGPLAIGNAVIGNAPTRSAAAGRPAFTGAGGPISGGSAPLAGARMPVLLADGLAEATDSHYVYDAKSKAVHVEMTTTIRNLKPDQGLAYFYWNNYAVPVPHNAKDLRAVSNGVALSIDLQDSEDKHTKWAMAVFADLLYGNSRTIEWSFTIPGDPIRSEGYTRMGKGYATFEVYASGDLGSTNVEIVAPKGMEFTSSNGQFIETSQDGSLKWTSELQSEDYGIWSLVSLRDRDAADSTKVTVNGEELTLLSFPGDKKWTKFVSSRLKDGLPVVEDMIGQEWPGGLQEIREDVSTEVVGYAWFDSRKKEIIIGEDLDEQLFFHELTHTWVNGDVLEGRWLSEGLTEVIARRVVKEMGGKVERGKVGRHDTGSLPLNNWDELAGSFSDVDRETETYAYEAAPAAIEQVVADLDDKEFTALVSALIENESPYQRDGDRSVWGNADWRRMLDLLEDQAGVEGAEKTLKTWVLTDKQKKELPKRAKARKAYFALDKADGAWGPPEGLRTQMTKWNFAQAGKQHKKIGDVPEFALRIQDAAAAGGFEDPATVRKAYEQAVTGQDFDDLGDLMPAAAGTTEHVSAVVQKIDADSDPFTELGEVLLSAEAVSGLSVDELDAGNLEAASVIADRAKLLSNLALWAGIVAILLVLGLAVAVYFLVRMVRRRSTTAHRDGSAGPDVGPGAPEAGSVGPEVGPVAPQGAPTQPQGVPVGSKR